MTGSKRTRRRKRYQRRLMARLGLRPCGCCCIHDQRQQREIQAALIDLRTNSIGGKVKL